MPAIFWIGFALLWVLVLVQGFALLEVIRQLVELREATARQPGSRAPAETVPIGEQLPPAPASLRWASSGEAVDWSDVLGERATALVFLSPGCGSCRTVAGDISSAVARLESGVRIVPVVAARSPDHMSEFVAATGLPAEPLLLENGAEQLARSLNVNRKPVAVILRGTRIRVAAIALSGDHIGGLLAEALREPEPAASAGAST